MDDLNEQYLRKPVELALFAFVSLNLLPSCAMPHSPYTVFPRSIFIASILRVDPF